MGEPSAFAIPAEVRKPPPEIFAPATDAVAEPTPSSRFSSCAAVWTSSCSIVFMFHAVAKSGGDNTIPPSADAGFILKPHVASIRLFNGRELAMTRNVNQH